MRTFTILYAFTSVNGFRAAAGPYYKRRVNASLFIRSTVQLGAEDALIRRNENSQPAKTFIRSCG